MKWVVAGMTCLQAFSAFAQTDPNLPGCVYPKNPADQQATAERIMPRTLPYLDHQILNYRDENGAQTGAYAVRRSLRIYFYDKNNVLMGTAIRRSEAKTSYFDPVGTYLGQCINHKLTPDEHPSVSVPSRTDDPRR
jgi:hypothetical protein